MNDYKGSKPMVQIREIKFRAWYKDGDGWVTSLKTDGLDIGRGDDLAKYAPEVHLMQYTGRKDKNGIEVYEGDILQTTEPYTNTKLHETVVTYNPNSSRFNGIPQTHEFVVVRNIYGQALATNSQYTEETPPPTNVLPVFHYPSTTTNIRKGK